VGNKSVLLIPHCVWNDKKSTKKIEAGQGTAADSYSTAYSPKYSKTKTSKPYFCSLKK